MQQKVEKAKELVKKLKVSSASYIKLMLLIYIILVNDLYEWTRTGKGTGT